VVGTRTDAHHAFSAHYFEDQIASIEGEITEFRWVNPHAWVYLSVRDADRVQRAYAAEWASPARLTRQRVSKDTLKPGDRVIVTGSPSREPSTYRLHLKIIERPADGWRWAGQRDRR
jgi:exonuclease VII large subunit